MNRVTSILVISLNKIYLLKGILNLIKSIWNDKLKDENILSSFSKFSGFGDSEKNVDLCELGIINDCIQIYQWIKSKTPNDLFVWGHSLGAALGVHTVRKLKELDIVPMGLVLESPFSTMREELKNTKTSKVGIYLL